MHRNRVAFLLPCSGSGQRMNMAVPKQFIPVHGQPIVEKTVSVIASWHDCVADDIVVVLAAAYQDKADDLRSIDPRVHVTATGGNSRHSSILVGLEALRELGYSGEDIVVVHDSVRPFIYPSICLDIIGGAREFGGGSAVLDLVSTVVMPDIEGFYAGMVDRSKYRSSQTPQAFQIRYLTKGYAECMTADEMQNHTECVDVAHRAGCRVKLYQCDWSLFKITHKSDLFVAQNLYPGHVAVVTGGGRGIGKRVAEMLASRLFHVVVAARTEAEIATVAAGIKGSFVVADVSSAASVASLFAQVDAAHGRLDVVVNCAGIMGTALMHETQEEDFERMLQVNTLGCFRCCKHAMTRMRAAGRGGVIVNVGSSSTIGGRAEQTAYAASKAATQTMTECMALESKAFGVVCYNVVPRRTYTGMRASMFPDEAPEESLSVDEVAEVVLTTILCRAPQTNGSTTYVK